MKLNKVLACGLLLGLLTSVSLAQHGRLAGGGTLPGARLPNAVNRPIGHTGSDLGRLAPNASKTGVQPDAVGTRVSKKTKANANRVPDRVLIPDAHGIGNRTALGPND
ncbi:MAG TPA: hypothetical protein VL240_11690 [Candidatus Binatia bacterium]|nr:hypothetical protein [Candidatus Binatia bacterium]